MDLYSIGLAIGVIALGYFVLKKWSVIIAMTFLGFAIAFTGLFVLRDMLHIPVNDYVDTSKLDHWKYEARNYTDEEAKDIKDTVQGKKKELTYKVGKVNKTVSDELLTYRFEYSKLTEDRRKDILDTLGGRVKDDKFEAKLFGMSPYLDMTYDLGNAKMYNSKDGSELIIKFIENE